MERQYTVEKSTCEEIAELCEGEYRFTTYKEISESVNETKSVRVGPYLLAELDGVVLIPRRDEWETDKMYSAIDKASLELLEEYGDNIISMEFLHDPETDYITAVFEVKE